MNRAALAMKTVIAYCSFVIIYVWLYLGTAVFFVTNWATYLVDNQLIPVGLVAGHGLSRLE